jgi:hypothetical protein
MSGTNSTHLPEVSGNIEVVPATGTLIVDTGLRNVQAFGVTLAQPAVADAATVAGVIGDPLPGGNQKLTITTVKADGVTLGSVAAKISWFAIGK